MTNVEKKNYIVAIDLGSSNVVVAVAERDAEGRPVVRSIVSKPSQGVKAGMITNIEQVSNSIKAAVEAVGEELGIRITEAYTGISGDFVRCARHTDHVFMSQQIRHQRLHARYVEHNTGGSVRYQGYCSHIHMATVYIKLFPSFSQLIRSELSHSLGLLV